MPLPRVKPADLIYGLDDRPALVPWVLLGFQHVAVICPYLVMAGLVARAAGDSFSEARASLSTAMLGVALMTLLQALRLPGFGSGFFCPPVVSAIYLPPSLIAAQAGGLALCAGMTCLAGIFEAVFSRVVRVLRKVFPAVVSGVILMAVGVQLGKLGMEIVFDPQLLSHHTLGPVAWTAMLTLIPMMALGVWGRGLARLLGVLSGIVLGYAASVPLGQLPPEAAEHLRDAAWFGWPAVRMPGMRLDISLLAPFLIAGLASGLRTVGVLTTCQQINDAAWKRPDLRNVEAGVLADGLGSAVCGALGGMGASVSPSLVGIQKSTGATSRILAGSVAAWMVLLACLPKVSALVVGMPRPVMGAALFFSGALMLVAGVQVAVSRPITLRETLVIGVSLLLSLGVLVFRGFFSGLPPGLHHLLGSSLSVAVLSATGLNLLFLIGRRRRHSLRLASGPDTSPSEVIAYLQGRAREWALRADDLEHILAGIREAVSHIAPVATGPIEIGVAYDDFDCTVTFRYSGTLPTMGGNVRAHRGMIEEQSFVVGLSGCLAGVAADGIRTSVEGDVCEVRLLFRV